MWTQNISLYLDNGAKNPVLGPVSNLPNKYKSFFNKVSEYKWKYDVATLKNTHTIF